MSAQGVDTLNIGEMMTNFLEYYIHLIDTVMLHLSLLIGFNFEGQFNR